MARMLADLGSSIAFGVFFSRVKGCNNIISGRGSTVSCHLNRQQACPVPSFPKAIKLPF
jgi:hypothetical protein